MNDSAWLLLGIFILWLSFLGFRVFRGFKNYKPFGAIVEFVVNFILVIRLIYLAAPFLWPSSFRLGLHTSRSFKDLILMMAIYISIRLAIMLHLLFKSVLVTVVLGILILPCIYFSIIMPAGIFGHNLPFAYINEFDAFQDLIKGNLLIPSNMEQLSHDSDEETLTVWLRNYPILNMDFVIRNDNIWGYDSSFIIAADLEDKGLDRGMRLLSIGAGGITGTQIQSYDSKTIKEGPEGRIYEQVLLEGEHFLSVMLEFVEEEVLYRLSITYRLPMFEQTENNRSVVELADISKYHNQELVNAIEQEIYSIYFAMF